MTFASLRLVAPVAGCLLAAALIPATAFAHGNHTHGHGTARAELAGQTLTVQLEIPLESFLGYDYPPKGDAQQKLWQDFVAQMATPGDLLSPAAEAGCVLDQHNISPDIVKPEAGRDIDNLRVKLVYQCKEAAALKSLAVPAFARYPGLKQLRLQWSAGSTRKTVTIRPRFPAVTL